MTGIYVTKVEKEEKEKTMGATWSFPIGMAAGKNEEGSK